MSSSICGSPFGAPPLPRTPRRRRNRLHLAHSLVGPPPTTGAALVLAPGRHEGLPLKGQGRPLLRPKRSWPDEAGSLVRNANGVATARIGGGDITSCAYSARPIWLRMCEIGRASCRER